MGKIFVFTYGMRCELVKSCFPDVDFATLTRDPVYSCSVAGIRFIFMGVEKSLKFVGREAVDLDACLLEDVLELM